MNGLKEIVLATLICSSGMAIAGAAAVSGVGPSLGAVSKDSTQVVCALKADQKTINVIATSKDDCMALSGEVQTLGQ